MPQEPFRITVVTDVWRMQNGTASTIATTVEHLRRLGHDVDVIHPERCAVGVAYPNNEIPLSLIHGGELSMLLDKFKPTNVHIATEGNLGQLARAECVTRGWQFTTAKHTNWPVYCETLRGDPQLRHNILADEESTWRYLHWFDKPAARVMVTTPSFEGILRTKGYQNEIRIWTRGVDPKFYPRVRMRHDNHLRLLWVGRLSPEKNVQRFLQVSAHRLEERTGSVIEKYVVGEGPLRAELEGRFPEVKFLGHLDGEGLAQCMSNADLQIFTSYGDTFGKVIVEGLACGLPCVAVAAPGPIDILKGHESAGVISDDLEEGIVTALRCSHRDGAITLSGDYTWEIATKQFLENLVPVTEQ